MTSHAATRLLDTEPSGSYADQSFPSLHGGASFDDDAVFQETDMAVGATTAAHGRLGSEDSIGNGLLDDFAKQETGSARGGQISAGRRSAAGSVSSALDAPQTVARSMSRKRKRKRRKKRASAAGASLQSLAQLWKDREVGRPALLVLAVCLVTYMFNHVDRYLISVVAADMQRHQGWGPGDGSGWHYDLLVGGVFNAVYLAAGIPMGILADKFPQYRVYLLALALFIWSLSVIWAGFSQHFWEVALSRVLLAFAQSACTPLAGSIITDWFHKEHRATALGVYNFGIYSGYAMAVGVANILNNYYSWRTVWWIFGVSGLIWSVVVLFIPHQSPRQLKQKRRRAQKDLIVKRRRSSGASGMSSIGRYDAGDVQSVSVWEVVQYFAGTPTIWLLFLGSLVRNAGGYVWAYNAKIFYSKVRNESGLAQGYFLTWIPLVCGWLGAVFGAYVSERFVKKAASSRRLLVLVASNLCAAPFAFLALTVPCPWSYLCLIPSNVIGEMWVGVCLALVVEFVPSKMKSTALALYFFLIGFAGFFPQFVTPFKHALDSYQSALVCLFPGLYVLSALIFLQTFCFMQRDRERARATAERMVIQ